jgi:hypothetical protein
MTADLLCTELSALPALSSQIPEDQRRLQIFLELEDRFMPTYHRLHDAGRLAPAEDEDRTRMLETMHKALCPGLEVSRSDVYHLAVNLMDRFLSYENVKSERDLCATSAACAMISLKILRAREECLSYDYLRSHFDRVPESKIRGKEKAIATTLKWNLNAVTTANFIDELSRPLALYFDPSLLQKVVTHSLTLANVSLLNHQFMKVPPSLLASACLCDAVKHLAAHLHGKCVEELVALARLEQDVLLQHEASVGYMVELKLQALENCHTSTPAGLEEIENREFCGPTRFNFPDTLSLTSSSSSSVDCAQPPEFQSQHHHFPVPEPV